MFNRITLALFIVIVLVTTIVSCTSDNNIEQRQILTNYQINPPDWLQGIWINADGNQFIFSTDNIQYSASENDSWKYEYELWIKYFKNNQCKFYDKVKTATYYEAEYFYFEGILVSNIKVVKIGENDIEIEYTDYDGLGKVYSIENYVLERLEE